MKGDRERKLYSCKDFGSHVWSIRVISRRRRKLILKKRDEPDGRPFAYFFLKIGTVLHGSPYIILLATGLNFFVTSR